MHVYINSLCIPAHIYSLLQYRRPGAGRLGHSRVHLRRHARRGGACGYLCERLGDMGPAVEGVQASGRLVTRGQD